MRAIQEFCVNRPIATIMFYLGLILMGLLSFRDLEIDFLPDISYPRITVATLFPNAAPAEVENLITRPISEAAGTVSGIESVVSESVEGVSLVTLQFSWGVNIDFAVMEVREKIDLVRNSLPEDAGRSIVTRFDPSQSAFMELVFFAKDQEKEKDLRNFLRNEVKYYLERVDGVAMVQFSGGYKKEVQVEVDQHALLAHGLNLHELSTRISTSNLNFPAGHITVGSKDILVRSLGEYKSIEDIGKTIVGRNKGGVPIPLSSVAKIKDGYRERKGMARYNGKECIIVSLFKEAGKNTVNVAAGVRGEVENINKIFAKDTRADIVYDESIFIERSINNLFQAIVFGGILAFLALILILRNLSSPLILLCVVPISIVTSFIFMRLYGVTLNMMSLGGLQLGVGMLFDSGNVVLSAIFRHSERGANQKESALRGAGEVVGSITSAILTTVIVFLPVIFLKNVVGVVFAEMALTITVSLLITLVVSLTLIPTLCALRMPARNTKTRRPLHPALQQAAVLEERIQSGYEKRISFFLDHPKTLFLGVGALFLIALMLAPFVKREFIPRVDTGEFSLELRNSRGSSLPYTAAIAAPLEKRLKEQKELKHVISRVGYDPDQVVSSKSGSPGTHRAEIRAVLRAGEDTAELVRTLREKIKPGDDLKVTLRQRSDVLSEILSPDARAISLELSGDDLPTLFRLGTRIRNDVKKIPGVVGATSGMEEKSREFHISFDNLRMSAQDFSGHYISQYLKTAVAGTVVTNLRVGDEEIDVRLIFRKSDRHTIKDIRSMLLTAPGGSPAYLEQLTEIQEEQGYTSIIRKAGTRINRISADVENRNVNDVFSDLDDYLGGLKLPPGYDITFAGERENISDSFGELLLAFALSILLIYMLLSAKFESLIFSLVMLGAIPLILIGIVPALLLSGKSLNVSSFTGIILLGGIVVDNSALLFEYIQILIEEGRGLKAAVMEGASIVLRPIMMNTGTTLLGMAPVALEFGVGLEFQSPMAITVISGMATSVIISLFVLPALFYLILKSRLKPDEEAAP